MRSRFAVARPDWRLLGMTVGSRRSRRPRHRHGLLDPTVRRSPTGVRAAVLAFVLLGAVATAQLAIFAGSLSMALLADLIRNYGDAAALLPLGVYLVVRSAKAELVTGRLVVLGSFAATCMCGFESFSRLLDPPEVEDPRAVAIAGGIGVLGSGLAALLRVRAGRTTGNSALLADGRHTYLDAAMSAAVIASAVALAAGQPLLDPLIGLALCLAGTWIAWNSWWAVDQARTRLG